MGRRGREGPDGVASPVAAPPRPTGRGNEERLLEVAGSAAAASSGWGRAVCVLAGRGRTRRVGSTPRRWRRHPRRTLRMWSLEYVFGEEKRKRASCP